MSLPRTLVILPILFLSVSAFGNGTPQAPTPPDWDEDVLDMFRTLPMQESGRVKPLDTFAGFMLLNMNANRDWEDTQGNKHSHIEWFVNTMFFPETAKHYKVFFIENAEVLDDIGVEQGDAGRFGRYSFAQLEPAIPRLLDLAREYSRIEPKDQTAYQRQVLDLWNKVSQYQQVQHFMEFAQQDYPVNTSEGLRYIFDGKERASYSEMLAKAPEMRRLLEGLDGGITDLSPEQRAQEMEPLEETLGRFLQMANHPTEIAIIPPTGAIADRREWLSPTGPPSEDTRHEEPGLWKAAFQNPEPPTEAIQMVAQLENLWENREDTIAFRMALSDFHDQAVGAAKARGEYEKIPLEVLFYKGWYFYKALQFFAVAFVLAALTFLAPASQHWFWRIFRWAPTLLTIVGTGYVVYGITLRSIIRERPPISTLYETILFITATLVIVALIIEFINRRRVALFCAAIMGFLGMMLANRYEIKEGVDTMPTLIAVLDTNFWLATHVTIINIGYAAGVLAAVIAHVFIIGKLFGIKKNDPKFYRDVTRMVYGTICFGVVFATVGTVLGGIWANDSWGRFWGWDPKENGALMIVIWQLFMLHGRMGGYLKQHGFNNAAVFGGMIVMFSWWHVNHLGVGLHSYGFTDGVIGNLLKYYAVEGFVIALGGFVWFREKVLKPRRVQTKTVQSDLEEAVGK